MSDGESRKCSLPVQRPDPRVLNMGTQKTRYAVLAMLNSRQQEMGRDWIDLRWSTKGLFSTPVDKHRGSAKPRERRR